jgi:HEAT repeat protein/DNA-directed RNA polymerase subunit RPC12/RpoP
MAGLALWSEKGGIKSSTTRTQMDTKYACPHCSQHVIIPDAPRGTLVDCPNCRRAFRLDDHDQAGVKRRLASPWVWLIAGVIAICLSAPFIRKMARPEAPRQNHAPQSKVAENITDDRADPVIAGKALSVWLEDLASSQSPTSRQAEAVLRDSAGVAKPVLVHAIEDASISIRLRRQAPEALSLMIGPGDPEIQVLFGALRDKDRLVSTSARRALRNQNLDAKTAVPILLAMSTDGEGGVRRTAAQFLGNFVKLDPEALSALKRLATDPDPIVADGANRTLIKISPPELIFANQRLTDALRDLPNGDPAIRKSARDRLRAVGRAAVPELISAMDNQEGTSRDRALAAQALGYAGKNQEPEVSALISALKDTDENVRENAAASLGLLKLDPSLFIPLCLDTLSDRSSRVRRRGAENLARLGPEAKEAIPALKKLAAKDGEAATRSAAKLALQKISPPSDSGNIK